MNIESTSASGLFLIIFIMAIVTLATRWGGVYVMAYIPITDRVKQFIQAMSNSVLVAVITPLATTGDNATRLALLTSAVTMIATKKTLVAIAAGIIMAAVFRLYIS